MAAGEPSWKITSHAAFIGTFYAPEADFTISGAGVYYGAVLVHSMTFGNGQSVISF